MKSRMACALALALIMAACGRDPQGLAGADISGPWSSGLPDAFTALELTQSGTTVTGTGGRWGNTNMPQPTMTITGTNTTAGVRLTFEYSTGRRSLYSAWVRGDRLAGAEVFTDGGSDSLVFMRRLAR